MKNVVEKCIGFQWDLGNSSKNWDKHRVTRIECEQVFFNKPILIADDKKHSTKEKRWFVLGNTDFDRKLFLVFSIRKNLIRIVSARNMSKKEKEIFNEEIKKHTEI